MQRYKITKTTTAITNTTTTATKTKKNKEFLSVTCAILDTTRFDLLSEVHLYEFICTPITTIQERKEEKDKLTEKRRKKNKKKG